MAGGATGMKPTRNCPINRAAVVARVAAVLRDIASLRLGRATAAASRLILQDFGTSLERKMHDSSS